MEGKSSDYRLRISFFGDRIEQIAQLDSLSNKIIKIFKTYVIYPANEYIADNTQFNESLKRIKNELELRKKYFRQKNKLIELQRITEKTNRDLEQLIETGFCSGIENYSAHLELRSKGQTPYTIFDYFGED
jgi:excinuclease ABC subunit B